LNATIRASINEFTSGLIASRVFRKLTAATAISHTKSDAQFRIDCPLRFPKQNRSGPVPRNEDSWDKRFSRIADLPGTFVKKSTGKLMTRKRKFRWNKWNKPIHSDILLILIVYKVNSSEKRLFPSNLIAASK
jgi:hypothetical protein